MTRTNTLLPLPCLQKTVVQRKRPSSATAETTPTKRKLSPIRFGKLTYNISSDNRRQMFVLDDNFPDIITCSGGVYNDIVKPLKRCHLFRHFTLTFQVVCSFRKCAHCQSFYISDLVKCTGLKTPRQGQPATGRPKEQTSRYTSLLGTTSAVTWETNLHSREGGGGEGGEGGGEDVA